MGTCTARIASRDLYVNGFCLMYSLGFFCAVDWLFVSGGPWLHLRSSPGGLFGVGVVCCLCDTVVLDYNPT